MNKNQPRKISLLTATAFAVGAMIGGGVFVLSGLALKQAGPAAILSFILAGLMVFLSALSFAVMASSSTPEASGYSLIGQVLGSNLWSFLTSWCFYLGGIIGAAFVLNAFGVYAHEFIVTHISGLLWSIGAAVVLTLINLGPASKIGKIESFLVSGKLCILILLIIFGILHFHGSMLKPFNPHGTMHILITSAFLFIAFLGFNVITNMAQDIENPARTIPRAILLSMLVVTIVYLGVVISLLAGKISNYSEASVGVAAQHLMGPIGGLLVIIGALVSTLSSVNANILGSSEIMLRMASQKAVPTVLGKMRHGHPYISVIAGAVLYVALLLTRQTQMVINLANVTAIIALIIVNVAAAKILTLKVNGSIKLPFKWLLPVLGIVGAVSQFFFMPFTSVLIGFALAGSGLIVYILRNRYHSPHLHKELVAVIEEMEGPLVRALKR